jgi:hypothetical protein
MVKAPCNSIEERADLLSRLYKSIWLVAKVTNREVCREALDNWSSTPATLLEPSSTFQRSDD